jgi:hypothetical protein
MTTPQTPEPARREPTDRAQMRDANRRIPEASGTIAAATINDVTTRHDEGDAGA